KGLSAVALPPTCFILLYLATGMRRKVYFYKDNCFRETKSHAAGLISMANFRAHGPSNTARRYEISHYSVSGFINRSRRFGSDATKRRPALRFTSSPSHAGSSAGPELGSASGWSAWAKCFVADGVQPGPFDAGFRVQN